MYVRRSLFLIRTRFSASTRLCSDSSTTAHPSRDEQWIGSIKSFDEIPGPKRFPLIGSLWVYNSLVGKYSLSRLHETHRLLRAAYGDIVREDLAGTNVLILFNIQDIEKMFRLEGKYPERRSHTALLKYRLDRPQYYNNGGLLPTNGPTWWKLRAPLQKPLSRVQCVRAHLSDVQSVAFSLIDLIEQLRDSDGQVPDLQSWLARAALETAGCVVMERRLGCLNQNLSADSMPQRLMDASFKSLECIIKTDFSFPWWKWFPTQSYKELVAAQETIRQVAQDVVRRKTAFLENHGPSDPPSLLESWLSTAELDEKDVIAMVSDFLFASVDTTSFSFSYLLYLLSSNSTVQEKARAEALSLTMPITATALARGIPYLKATVKESMRLFPISVGIGRITTQDLVLSGYRIPTGTVIVTGNQVISQDRNLVENPDAFLPERYLTSPKGGESKRDNRVPPFASLPFGYGPRSCIGRRLAEQTLYVWLIAFLRKYRMTWTAPDPLDCRTNLLNAPDAPLRILFENLRKH